MFSRSPAVKVCNSWGIFCSGPFNDKDTEPMLSQPPSISFSMVPSDFPSIAPSSAPSSFQVPSDWPNVMPSDFPSPSLSSIPSDFPSLYPSIVTNKAFSPAPFILFAPTPRPTENTANGIQGFEADKFAQETERSPAGIGNLLATTEKTIACLLSALIVSMLVLLWQRALRRSRRLRNFRTLSFDQIIKDEDSLIPSLRLVDAPAQLSTIQEEDPIQGSVKTLNLPWKVEAPVGRTLEDLFRDDEGNLYGTERILDAGVLAAPEAFTTPEIIVQIDHKKNISVDTERLVGGHVRDGISEHLRFCGAHPFLPEFCSGRKQGSILPTFGSGSSSSDVGVNPFDTEDGLQLYLYNDNDGEI